MAILGSGDYLCELCRFFNTDGIDGNHPYCMKQDIDSSKAVKLDEPCPYGWKYGIPTGYPSSIESNRKRARELLNKIYEGRIVNHD